jgi:hypothetical protein
VNLLNGLAAVATVVSLLLAVWQFLAARHIKQNERERIAQQHERLRTAVSAAIAGAETADLIIQRGKEEGVTVQELQNLARTMRLQLSLLARQLEYERSILGEWQPRSAMRTPPARVEIAKDASADGQNTATPDSTGAGTA